MQCLTLNNGVSIPQIGLGVWPLTDGQAYTAVSHALITGYRHIDTARIYNNEAGVGRAVRDAGVRREDIFLTTKLWNADQGYEAALRAFDASLQRLGTDYVDLYLIHWPVPEQDLYVESYKALERIHADGRARAIGVSNFTAATLDRLLAKTDIVPAPSTRSSFTPTSRKAECAGSAPSGPSPRGPGARSPRVVYCSPNVRWPVSPRRTGRPRPRSSSAGISNSATW